MEWPRGKPAVRQGEIVVTSKHVVYEINPLVDVRWPKFIQRHPNSSVFHTGGWLNALHDTYGYEPVAFTTSAPSGELTNALLFCAVRSCFTGRRLVSLPFSDHCEPLVEDLDQFQELCTHAAVLGKKQSWKYIEMRNLTAFSGLEGSFRKCKTYRQHRLDLRPSLDALYKSFHKDCVRRRIRRAERQALQYEEGRSEALLRHFYALMVRTRLRKHLPPQPFEWFQNLVTCIGKNVCIRVAYKGDQPIAAILTMDHGKKMYYKYGGSDERFHNLGATPMLFWKAIQAGKAAEMEELDLGRSELGNRGLIRFKERWAAEGMPLTLWRAPADVVSPHLEQLKVRLAKMACTCSPGKLLILAGRLLYRHIG
jgi:CelD/BcsL family acetyltransferase involved in cellulose biosynthesis